MARLMARLQSIQVSTPKTVGSEDALDPLDRVWTTAFYKEPVAGAVTLFPDHLAGDGVSDTRHHGGLDKAVLCYSTTHYDRWRVEYPHLQFDFGGFGENFTIDVLTESTVCIGDVLAIGEALLEVAQPRIPCWKISRRWQTDGLTEAVRDSGRTGWYVRVLQPGVVESGMTVVLQNRPCPDLTVAAANDVMHGRVEDAELLRALVDCNALADVWRSVLRDRMSNA